MTTEPKKPLIPNRAYDVLKYISLILLPGCAALYFGLAQIWNLPNAEKVVGTVTVVDTFLGLLLGLSTKQYNKDAKYDGAIEIEESESGSKMYSLNLRSNPEVLDEKKEVTFKVQSTP